ncbi:MAG: mediator of RNA polymerase II transcription subunit 22 [Thaumarchaeota archaeon]|nr:mediator of RNA polymerase II transcription subunit 22 [Nitrososphaerota archaeon]
MAALTDREGRIVAEILERFRNLMMAGTERVTPNASPGDAAFNSMRMDMEANGLVRPALLLLLVLLVLLVLLPD